MKNLTKAIFIIASTLFATTSFATGSDDGCSQFPHWKGGLACNLYCGDGFVARKLNCTEKSGGPAPSAFCPKIQEIFAAKTNGETLPCVCPCSGKDVWEAARKELSISENVTLSMIPGGKKCFAENNIEIQSSSNGINKCIASFLGGTSVEMPVNEFQNQACVAIVEETCDQ